MVPPFTEAFPKELAAQAEVAIAALDLSSDYDFGRSTVNVLGETLLIPNRVLSPKNRPDLSGLSPQQRQIAQCVLTRGNNGFERQAALKEVLPINAPWSIPFVIALVGDYVIEIIAEIDAGLPQLDGTVVANFIADNPAFYQRTCSRVMSYWSCNYRWEIPRSDYIGFRVLRALDAMRSPTNDR